MGLTEDGRVLPHSKPQGFFQELAPQDGTGYMDVGKVAFPFRLSQEQLSSRPSFLWGERGGVAGSKGEGRKIGLQHG